MQPILLHHLFKKMLQLGVLCWATTIFLVSFQIRSICPSHFPLRYLFPIGLLLMFSLEHDLLSNWPSVPGHLSFALSFAVLVCYWSIVDVYP